MNPKNYKNHFFTQALYLLLALCLLAGLLPALPAQALPPPPPTEDCESGCQRSGGDKSQLTVGDPVNAGNGAYQFTLPLLNLGGPMGLHFDLIYGSDLSNNWIGDDDFPRFFRFWWSPKCVGRFWTHPHQFWLEDFRSVALDGETGEILEWGEAQPVRYQMQETTGYVYLMDPIRERVYVFEKNPERILYILDRNGNTLTYIYDAGGDLTQIADGLGRELNFTRTDYSGDTVLTQVADQAGRSISLNYEENAADNDNELSLRSVTDPLGHTTTFSYTAVDGTVDNVTAVRRPLGNTPYTQSYACIVMSGTIATRVTTQTDAYDNAVSFTYDLDQNQVTTDWADGSTVIYQHYGHHEPPKGLTDAVSNTIGFARNDRDQVTAVTDRMGDTTSLTYHAESGKMASITNNEGDTITNHYITQTQTFTNPAIVETVVFIFYNLTQVDYPDSTHEAFAYDVHGNVITYTDQVGQEWGYQYNDWGQVTKATNPSGGMVDYTYNADGTLASSTDSDTDFTTYGYDGYKRPVTITHPGGAVQIAYDLNDQMTSITDERDKTYNYEYDANSNLVRATDPFSRETTYAHDLMERVAEYTNRRGKTSQYTYDEMGRLASGTDPNGNPSQFDYDSRDWLNRIIDPAGKVWQFGYDDEGLVISTTTPLSRTATFERDQLGYLIGVTDPLRHTTTFTRDEMSRVTAVTDPLSHTTVYTYDERSLLTGVALPDGGAASYDYNELGLLDTIHDLGGNEWAFGYTSMGRFQSLTDPLSNTWGYTYNQRGLLDQVAYPVVGQVGNLSYDAAGNLIRRQYSAGPNLNFSYDDLGRLTAADGITLTYNEVGQVTNTQNPPIFFGAAYDDGGRLVTVTYAGILTVTYDWDERDLLTRVSDSLTGASVQFTYDDDGRLTGMTRSNGVNTALAWDAASRLTRLQEGSLADMQYTYNGAGEVTQAALDLPLNPADYLVGQVTNLTYDEASQVSAAGYSYDAQGRLTAAPGHTYTWDGASRLVGVGQNVILSYNGLGDLLTRAEGGNTTHYYYNYALGLQPIVAERDEDSGQWQRFYVLTPNGTLLYAIDVAEGNQVSFYHYDKMGNTLLLTGADGSLTDAYAYTPYGQLLHHQGTNDQPFTFGGAYQARREGDSDLYHIRARYYDANSARFISREPLWPRIGTPQALNPYQYARQNPMLYVDRTGMLEEVETPWEPVDAAEAAGLFVDCYGLSPKEYAEWRTWQSIQASSIIDQKTTMKIASDIGQYAAEWGKREYGDPEKFEMTPKQYAEWRVVQVPSIIDQKTHYELGRDIGQYAAEWGKRNVGDPEKFEMTPKQYAEWRAVQAPSISDREANREITRDIEL